MNLRVMSLLTGLLLPYAATLEANPSKAKPKGGDNVKVEASGTVQKSTQADPTEGIFVNPPNCCAPSFLFKKDVERYEWQLKDARMQRAWYPRFQPLAKATYSLRIRDGAEWELDIDDRFVALFDRQVGKQVAIVGTVKGKRVRVVSVNGLMLD